MAPSGICLSFGEMSAKDLCIVLRAIARFLQELAPYVKLRTFNDWWEHDGLHFPAEDIEIDELFERFGSVKNLFEWVPNDDEVFAGVAPEDSGWYLRYRIEWDDEEMDLIGRCQFIAPESMIERFRDSATLDERCLPKEIPAGEFYEQTIV